MRLALWQTCPQPDIDTALAALSSAATTAAAQGADVLVTPEMFVGGYNIGADRIATHADQEQAVVQTLHTIARTHGIALVAGLAVSGPQRPFNACVAIDKSGREVARYHKTHLFGTVDPAQFCEGAALSPVFDLGGWKVALAICYDVEFPEVTRTLALRGADLILVPTANMTPFDSVATRLVPARAEENALYIAYCNYVGVEGQFAYNGLSCVVGPDGEDQTRGNAEQTLLYADLDRMMLSRARHVQTHLFDRRPDLYGALL